MDNVATPNSVKFGIDVYRCFGDHREHARSALMRLAKNELSFGPLLCS